MCLYRPSMFREKESIDLLANKTEYASIIIEKQRNGPVCEVDVMFKGYCMSFCDKREF